MLQEHQQVGGPALQLLDAVEVRTLVVGHLEGDRRETHRYERRSSGRKRYRQEGGTDVQRGGGGRGGGRERGDTTRDGRDREREGERHSYTKTE